MRATNMKKAILHTQLFLAAMMAVVLFTVSAEAAAPGIQGPTFNLVASQEYLNQPDGQAIYSWGYGCATTYAPTFVPANLGRPGICTNMQVPGPTLVVTEGQQVTVTLRND